jgi:ribosomal protein L3
VQLKDASKVAAFQPGQQLEIAAMFKEGDSIDIAGTTVGKGFQGTQHLGRQEGQQAELALVGSCQDCSVVAI